MYPVKLIVETFFLQLYYGLTNYFQNHRGYLGSRDDKQLLGTFESPPNKECGPFSTDENSNKTYIPCGAVANSLFNGNATCLYFVHL